jgi:hypothetical protein
VCNKLKKPSGEKMQKIIINSFQRFIEEIENIDLLGYDIVIYRGQESNYPLLPSIARKNPTFDSTIVEMEMLDELERRSPLFIRSTPRNKWEWLIFAQHFGLNTRLLDWTSNPLVALWFACKDFDKNTDDCFVYRLAVDKNMIVDTEKNKTPFNNAITRILRPTLNNERIIAQSGWFTAHRFFEKQKKFIALDKNSGIKKSITQFEITGKIKSELRDTLATLGVSARTLFPDIVGLCNHLNYKYRNSIK